MRGGECCTILVREGKWQDWKGCLRKGRAAMKVDDGSFGLKGKQ